MFKTQEESEKEQRKERKKCLNFVGRKPREVRNSSYSYPRCTCKSLACHKSLLLNNSHKFWGMLCQRQITFPAMPTAATTPIQSSDNSSNQGKNSFNPWDPYIDYE